MARLTTTRRKKLPATEFGFPRERSYPLDTLARTRSALARGKRNLSLGRYKELARRAKKRHPSMKIAILGDK